LPVVPDAAVSLQTAREERANVWTHGIGLALAAAGSVVGLIVAAGTGSVTAIVTTLVFGVTLVLMFFASTGFHLAAWHRHRNRWRLLDHASIYLLIAGTYTPVMLLAVGGAWGWSIVGIVWGLAVVGVSAKLLLVGRFDAFDRIDTAAYLAMGWLCVVALVPIYTGLSTHAFVLLAMGGLAYSAGCIFFVWERLPFNHAIWHGFVLAGAVCHYSMIVGHVVPAVG
jgi:hemolysin III